MTISALSAAKAICEMRDWSVSNLELQKILYLAHMFHLGRTGKPLIGEAFEAWDYGPVVPELYHRVKAFGRDPVRNVFHWVPEVPVMGPERNTLAEAAEATRGVPASRLVALTHKDGGAWAKNYTPGMRGVLIPNADIAGEYRGIASSRAA